MEKRTIDPYIEPLILYAVLFFRFPSGSGQIPELVEFSIFAEIIRILSNNLPSLALIWYLLFKSWRLRKADIAFSPKNDISSLALSLPALVIIGLTISVVSNLDGIQTGPRYTAPENAVSWIILGFSCLTTAYLEESYFRFYLLTKRVEMGISPYRIVVISTLMFSVCHAYAGPWGFLNAAFSGAVLAIVFLRFRSLHGIALAHALYNILVYTFSAV